MDSRQLSHSESHNPPRPDVYRHLAEEQDRRRKQEQSQLNELWVDELRPSFVAQAGDHYRKEIYQRMRGWNLGVIKMTRKKYEQGNMDQIIQEMNLTKIPDEAIKIPDEVVKKLENINVKRKDEFEEKIKQLARNLWQQDWDIKDRVELAMSRVLDKRENEEEEKERRQRLNDLVNRGLQIADDQFQQLVDLAKSLRIRRDQE